MNNNKLNTITGLFEDKQIRSVWDKDKEDYYFSVVDIIDALVEPTDPSDYWTTLKRRLLKEEESLLPTNCRKIKMLAKDGKYRETDTLDTGGIFRLIESIPSKKAEPLKLWLAKLGRQKIDEVFDPSKGIDEMIDYYQKKGYSIEWIETRIKAIINRKKLTNIWRESGIHENIEYAILTNTIYKEWSNMTAGEYKSYKGIRKENLRDNMTDLEVALTDLGEIATRELAKKHKPKGLKQNEKIAKMGGSAAKVAREHIEKNLGESIISNKNSLNYEYIEEKKITN